MSRRERNDDIIYTNDIKQEKDKIIKTFKKNNFSWWSFKETNKSMENEINSYNLIKQQNIASPKIINTDETKRKITMSKCKGDCLLSKIGSFDYEKLKKILYDIGILLAKIHKSNKTNNFVNYHSKEYYENVKKEVSLLKISANKTNEFFANLYTISNDIDEQDIVFTHGDFHFGNIMLDDNKITGIIDWEESCHHSRYVDISTIAANIFDFVNKKYQMNILDAFISGYSTESKIDICHKKIGLFMELNYYKYMIAMKYTNC